MIVCGAPGGAGVRSGDLTSAPRLNASAIVLIALEDGRADRDRREQRDQGAAPEKPAHRPRSCCAGWAPGRRDSRAVFHHGGRPPPRARRWRPMRRLLGHRRSGLAVITPLPPAETGIATYSARLLEAMARVCDVRVYADGGAGASPPDPRPGARCPPCWER